MRGEDRWRRRRLVATLIWLAGRVGPVVLALAAAFAATRLVARPTNPGALLWWLGIAAIGMAAFRLLYGLMLRARALAALLSVTATFPSRPPSRAAIAWAMPDTLRLRRGLDELSKGAWTPESQSRRAALVAALWALDESIRHPGLLWRSSDGDAGARVAEGDIPGLLQVIPPPSIHHRTITAGIGFAALALLFSSMVVTGVQSEQSSQLARGGPADIPVSPQSGAPGGENPPATEAPESAAPATPPVGSPSAPSQDVPAAEPTPRPVLEGSSAQPQRQADSPATSQSVSPVPSSDPSAAPEVQLVFPAAGSDVPLVADAGRLTTAVDEAPPLPAAADAPQLRATTVLTSPEVAIAQAELDPGWASTAESSTFARVASADVDPSTASSSMTSLGDVASAAPYDTIADDQPRGGDERPPTADGSAELCRDSITTAESPAPANVDESVPVTAPTRLAPLPIPPSSVQSTAAPATDLGG